MRRGILWIGVFFIIFSSFSSAEEQDGIITTYSRVMNYQGILKNSAGDPVDDGDYNLTFRIYDAAEGGSLLWMETATIATSDGFFTRQLGLSSPLNLPFNADYYLSIQVQGDVAMAERQRFTLSPYSARSDTAETATNADLLDGQHASAFSLTSHNHDAAYVNEGQSNSINSSMISDGTVAAADILDGSIATADIQNSTILFNDIAQNGATTNQVMKWNGSAWIAGNDSTGGGSNWSLTSSVLYTNGNWGITRGIANNILLGTASFSHTNLGSACTTGASGFNNAYITVGGGYANRARGQFSVIGGGVNNCAIDYAAVAGGNANYAGGSSSFVGGGYGDTASSSYSVIGGGINNVASGNYSAIIGGDGNLASGSTATIGGGRDNSSLATYGTINGGYRNNIATGADFGIIGGGYRDTVKAVYGGIAAGYLNSAGDASTDTGAFVGGGLNNNASALSSVVCGGKFNEATQQYSVVSGGFLNNASGSHSIVAGGYSNNASQLYSTVSGGYQNDASGVASNVTGGYINSASGSYSIAVGGRYNSASGISSIVAGGDNSYAQGDASAILGGENNIAYGVGSLTMGGLRNYCGADHATIAGGTDNYVSGYRSAIIAGGADTIGINGPYSMVFGRGVVNDNNYRVIFFDSDNPGSFNINRDYHDGNIYAYPIQVGNSASNGNGAYLSTGGTWTNGSSRTFKENFTPYNGAELLAKISNLSLTSYNYINSTEKHFGPVAEEFVGAFDTGVIRETDGKRDDQYLSAGDVAGVALAGVQELNRKLERENQELKKMIQDLQSQINEIKKR